jgi:hypothetical protein
VEVMKVKVLKREMLILESLGLDKPSFVLGVIEVHQCRRVDKYGFEHRSDKLPDDLLTAVNYTGEDIAVCLPLSLNVLQEFFPGFNEIRFSEEDLKDEF